LQILHSSLKIVLQIPDYLSQVFYVENYRGYPR